MLRSLLLVKDSSATTAGDIKPGGGREVTDRPATHRRWRGGELIRWEGKWDENGWSGPWADQPDFSLSNWIEFIKVS